MHEKIENEISEQKQMLEAKSKLDTIKT